ncbi:cadherin-8-like [Ruditapes philippinarum]|uniref:cadherin-8-like n=1 Tax=Ruditapes philippinarum TaxID=129788 RepID=UPI00295B9FEF|nr:cadherin-8-like [Ruditapes philippinarum]
MERYTFVVICLALVLKTSDAQITAWEEPAGSTTDVNAATTATIAESLATGTATGVTIKATGTDTPTYAIASQATSGKLTIEASTGVLTLAAGTFDFETEPTYVLTIVATAGGSTGTASTTISITDVNEAPEFSASDYTTCIVDGSTEGKSVIALSASDQDDGDIITYSIASGDTNTDFAISSTVLQVNTGKTLDMSKTSTYTLVVHAIDDDTTQLTGSATYTISVKSDCGNGAPALVATSMTILMALVAFLV